MMGTFLSLLLFLQLTPYFRTCGNDCIRRKGTVALCPQTGMSFPLDSRKWPAVFAGSSGRFRAQGAPQAPPHSLCARACTWPMGGEGVPAAHAGLGCRGRGLKPQQTENEGSVYEFTAGSFMKQDTHKKVGGMNSAKWVCRVRQGPALACD